MQFDYLFTLGQGVKGGKKRNQYSIISDIEMSKVMQFEGLPILKDS